MTDPLYKLTTDYARLLDNLNLSKGNEVDTGEATALLDALNKLGDSIQIKIKNIALHTIGLKHQRQVCETEAKRLGNRTKSLEAQEGWFKEYIRLNMKASGIKDVKTDIVNIFLLDSPASVTEIDMELLPNTFKKTIPETQVPNKEAILKNFEETGEVPPGVRIITDNTYIRIT